LEIVGDSEVLLDLVKDILKDRSFQAQDHVGEHLDEPPVAVKGEPLIARLRGESLDGVGVEA